MRFRMSSFVALRLFGLTAALAVLLTSLRTVFAQSGAISGVVYADANGNGIHDPGEKGIANVALTFTTGSGPVPGTTNADGTYFFTANVGAWAVTVVPPPGFEAVGGDTESVTIAAAEQNIVLDFGLRPIQVTVTNTPTSPRLPATGTPGVLPTTGAPIASRGLTFAALAATFIVGLGLLASAVMRARH